ncbi:MAG: hypothetical protein HYX54_08170 [Chloroflexi bacterium]|nr:hypothetical protein [Chloroflexota bacterium]
MTARPADPWPWPESLDGPTAAPDHHRVLWENDRVRVLETTISPGDTTPLHTHRAATVMYVVSGTSFIRRDPDGVVMLDTRAMNPPFVMPRVLWSEGNGAHTLENAGADPLIVIGVELKD